MLVFMNHRHPVYGTGGLAGSRRSAVGLRLELVPAEELQHLADGAFPARRLRQRQVVLDLVPVPTPVALLDHLAGLREVGDHGERGPLGDAEGRRDVAEANPGIARDAQQDPGVIGEEGPLGHPRTLVRKVRKPTSSMEACDA